MITSKGHNQIKYFHTKKQPFTLEFDIVLKKSKISCLGFSLLFFYVEEKQRNFEYHPRILFY